VSISPETTGAMDVFRGTALNALTRAGVPFFQTGPYAIAVAKGEVLQIAVYNTPDVEVLRWSLKWSGLEPAWDKESAILLSGNPVEFNVNNSQGLGNVPYYPPIWLKWTAPIGGELQIEGQDPTSQSTYRLFHVLSDGTLREVSPGATSMILGRTYYIALQDAKGNYQLQVEPSALEISSASEKNRVTFS